MRRSKQRVVWLPQTNAFSVDNQTGNISTIGTILAEIAGPAGSKIDSGAIPLVIDDHAEDPTVATTSLSDLFNSGYRLRRIVGKVWCAARQEIIDNPPTVVATAGIMVRRVDKTGAALAINENETSPQVIGNSSDPWIWRRSWILCNRAATTALTGPNNAFASASTIGTRNDNPGGNSDGPHVDAKTARLIGPEERLFFHVALTVLEGTDSDANGTTVRFAWDFRFLASLRTTTGNRRNASR